MKKILIALLFAPTFVFSQFCDLQGDVAIYDNYNGGILNINVDVDIPNLKIGVRSYAGVEINLSGAFVNNVVEVYYTGYNSSNNHCGSSINTSVNGAPSSAQITIDGYTSLGSWGSCSNATTTSDFILNQVGGTLLSHTNTYNCWGGGIYNISDGGTCCNNGSAPPTPITFVSSTKTGISCNGDCDGEAEVFALGGTQPITYSWSQGGNTTTSASNLCAGSYTVTATDGNGNTDVMTIVIDEVDTIGVVPTIADAFCYGESSGSALLNFTGGTAPFSVDWGGEHPYQLPAGVHTYEITDANGCQKTGSVFIDQPDSLSATFDIVNVTDDCNGAITIYPAGGTSPYDISWDSVSSTYTIIDDLCPGDYCAEIIDGNGCVASFCATVADSSGNGGGEVGLDYYSATQTVELAPNPSAGTTNLKINSENSDNAELRVYNALGEQVLFKKVTISKGENTHALNVQESGFYIVVVVTKNSQQTLRWIVK